MGAEFVQRIDENGINRKAKVASLVSKDLVPYCADLQNKGAPINIANYLMGLSDISVTASIYTHITDQAKEDAAKLINGGGIITDVVTQVDASLAYQMDEVRAVLLRKKTLPLVRAGNAFSFGNRHPHISFFMHLHTIFFLAIMNNRKYPK